jgi:hypothetical protein
VLPDAHLEDSIEVFGEVIETFKRP